jgi:hypothetical protein
VRTAFTEWVTQIKRFDESSDVLLSCRLILLSCLQRRLNVTRLCQYIVPAACMSSKLPEDCVAELLAGNNSSTVNSSSTVTSPGDTDRRRAVAIAVPMVVGGGFAVSLPVQQSLQVV